MSSSKPVHEININAVNNRIKGRINLGCFLLIVLKIIIDPNKFTVNTNIFYHLYDKISAYILKTQEFGLCHIFYEIFIKEK